jgi:hypothetical protein
MKITFDEYKHAYNMYYFDLYLSQNNSEKDKEKYKSIILLYNSQNKYNIFRFLDERYFDDNKYSKKALFFSKSVFITMFIYIITILYLIIGHYMKYNIYFPSVIITTILFIISLLLYQRYDFLFDKEKLKPKKTAKELRIIKMKNILK